MKLRGGVDLGGTKIQTAVVDERNDVRGEERAPTPTEGGPDDVAQAIAAAMREAAGKAGVEPGELTGIGIGSPGDANEETGVVSAAGNLPGWEGSFPLADRLAELLGPPVRLGNDVDVAVLAEYELGVAAPYRSALGVWWGTGVGGGIVIDGELWRGRGAAGEIGHVVVKRGGARCPCGRRGCMEAYAGRRPMEEKARAEHEDGRHTELFKLMRKHGRDRLTSGIWERALNNGDKLAEELVERAIEALGTGVGSAINLLDPEVVVLGGGLGDRLWPRYLDEFRAELGEHVFVEEPPDLRPATLGDLGGAIGATLLVSSSGG